MIGLADFKTQLRRLDGARLITGAQRRGFTLRLYEEGPEYVPDSSGEPRPDTWARIERVLERYNETGSKQPGDYVELTHHASYVLALLEALYGHRGPSTAIVEEVRAPIVAFAEATIPGASKPHQRVGSISNAHVGREFEQVAQEYFRGIGIELKRGFPIELGVSSKKVRRFDLGTAAPAVLVECKSHRWTEGDKVPSAKMTVWNESMYYFFLAPTEYRKCFFVLHDRRGGQGETLLDYYRRTYPHLIPPGVEFFEWDEQSGALVSM